MYKRPRILVICAAEGERVKHALALIELLNHHFTVHVHTPHRTKTVAGVIDAFLKQSDDDQAAVLVYMGDGNRAGWTISAHEFVTYQELAALLCQHKQKRVAVVNDVNYGQLLIRELIGLRDPIYTSVLANSRFDRAITGEVTSLIVESWLEGLRPEQKISGLGLGETGADHLMPVCQRWGELFDYNLLRCMRRDQEAVAA